VADEVEPHVAVPPAATPTPGDLYAELSSKTIWLGVAPAVDASGFVLLADITGDRAYTDTKLVEAKTYTDTKTSPLAPKASPALTGVPTAPTAAVATNNTQIATTQFDKDAIASATSGTEDDVLSPWVAGMITVWSGDPTQIGSGKLAGWHLCDGAALSTTIYADLYAALGTRHNGTPAPPAGTFRIPNLTDRFLVGSGNAKQMGDKNAMDASRVTSPNPATPSAHSHGAGAGVTGNTALTLAMLPAHSHPINIQNAPGVVSTSPAHSHGYTRYGAQGAAEAGPYPGVWMGGTTVQTDSEPGHKHTVTTDVVGNTGNTGSGATHSHTIAASGTHEHLMTSANIREVLPYLALAYIIKL